MNLQGKCATSVVCAIVSIKCAIDLQCATVKPYALMQGWAMDFYKGPHKKPELCQRATPTTT